MVRTVLRTAAAYASDPQLVPFLDALAGMLVAEEARLKEARGALRAVAGGPPPPQKIRTGRQKRK
jgi:hypothetical protein